MQGGDFRVCLCCFLFSCQRLVACQLLYHLLINNRFQFRSDDFPTARTAFIVQPFRAAEILFAGGIVDTHKSIPAPRTLIFPASHVWVAFRADWIFGVHQLLAAGQPGVGGDDTPMGSQYQTVFKSFFFCWPLHLALIQIAAGSCP